MNEITRFDDAPICNIEAEQQLLGAILSNNDALDRCADLLAPDHFFEPTHAEIYRIASARIRNGHLASPVTLKVQMQDHPGLMELGGPAYLARLVGASISGYAVRDYAMMILDAWQRRALSVACQEALSVVRVGGDIGEIAAGLQQASSALLEASPERAIHSFLKSATDAVNETNARYQSEAALMTTGLPALDAILGGLAPGDLCLIGGSTSMGKTAVAVEIATNVAVQQNKGVLFVSLEMTRQQLVNRMVSARTRVPYQNLRTGDLSEDQMRRYVRTIIEMESTRMVIAEKRVRDVPAIHAAAMSARRSLGDLSLVIVDYAQLVRAAAKSRIEEMVAVSIGLKAMAQLLEVPVVALVQVNREMGKREHRRPQLSDIKETGQFENDADQVIFCHREDYWLERDGPAPDKGGKITEEAKASWEADLAAVRNTLELIVRKNRHGPLATAQVGCHLPTNRFWKLGEGAE